nr:arginine biosynthesis bifunctional protein argj, chloroplastic [Quercus suber]
MLRLPFFSPHDPWNQVSVTGAGSEAEAAKIACSVASSSLGRCIKAEIQIGSALLLLQIKPRTSSFKRAEASNYLRKAGETHSTVEILISVGKLLKYA